MIVGMYIIINLQERIAKDPSLLKRLRKSRTMAKKRYPVSLSRFFFLYIFLLTIYLHSMAMVACQSCLFSAIILTRFDIPLERRNRLISLPMEATCKHFFFFLLLLLWKRDDVNVPCRQQQSQNHDGHKYRRANSYAHYLNTTGSLLYAPTPKKKKGLRFKLTPFFFYMHTAMNRNSQIVPMTLFSSMMTHMANMV